MKDLNPKFVMESQKHDCGCAVSCLASITGKSYDDVAGDFLKDFDEEGLLTSEIMDYLADHGFTVMIKQVSNYKHIDECRDEMFKPYAPVHIICLKIAFDGKFTHAVVMTANGELFCPQGTTDEELRKSYSVESSIGVF